MEKDSSESLTRPRERLGRQVYLLSFISLIADIASEMLYPITPLFLTSVLGASMTYVGIVEGIAEFVSQLLKIWGGRLSDRLKKRKLFIINGYLISALAKAAMGLASSWWFVLFTRSLDRVGKGLRTGPRDALLSDSVSANMQGRAFGFHRGMDTLGAVIGPVVGIGLLSLFENNLRQVFAWALIPGLFAVIICFLIKETHGKSKAAPGPLHLTKFKPTQNLKYFFVCWAIFSIANSNDMFLILKVRASGHSFTEVIGLYVLFNLIYALTAPYLGNLSDSAGRRPILMFGLMIFAVVYFGFAFATTTLHFAVLYALYGLFNAATEGIGKAWVVDLLDDGSHKATALAYFGAVSGFCSLCGSVAAGLLWDAGYSEAPFIMGGIGALTSLLAFSVFLKKHSSY